MATYKRKDNGNIEEWNPWKAGANLPNLMVRPALAATGHPMDGDVVNAGGDCLMTAKELAAGYDAAPGAAVTKVAAVSVSIRGGK